VRFLARRVRQRVHEPVGAFPHDACIAYSGACWEFGRQRASEDVRVRRDMAARRELQRYEAYEVAVDELRQRDERKRRSVAAR
jgi:hypothetical protein